MGQYTTMTLFFIAFCHLATFGWVIFKFPVDSEQFLATTNRVWWINDRYRYYIQHFYFVVTTCTTIGYGDITPDKDRDSEMLFGIFVMLAGLSLMSVVITLTAILLNRFKEQSLKVKKKMKDFSSWFGIMERNSRAEFPQKFVNGLNEFFKALYNLEVDTVVYSKFFDQLPPRHSEELEVKYHMAHESPFQELFDRFGKEITTDIIKGCQPCSFLAGTTILHRSKYSPGIYWITYGKVYVTYVHEDQPIHELTEGDSFGSFCLLEEQSRFNYIAKNTCMAHFLPASKLVAIIDKNGNSGIAFQELIKQEFKNLQNEKTVFKSLFRFRRQY